MSTLSTVFDAVPCVRTTRGPVTVPTGDPRSPVADQYVLGRAGEDLAAGWYAKDGYSVIGMRARCKPGEIDAVLRSPGGEIVFLEVKTRRSGQYGGAEAVDAKKFSIMRRCAAEWLEKHPQEGTPVRFDVCEVIIDGARFKATRFEGVEDGAC